MSHPPDPQANCTSFRIPSTRLAKTMTYCPIYSSTKRKPRTRLTPINDPCRGAAATISPQFSTIYAKHRGDSTICEQFQNTGIVRRLRNPPARQSRGGPNPQGWGLRCPRQRRGRDSNPRYLAIHTISSRAPSASRSPLHILLCREISSFVGSAGFYHKIAKIAHRRKTETPTIHTKADLRLRPICARRGSHSTICEQFQCAGIVHGLRIRCLRQRRGGDSNPR